MCVDKHVGIVCGQVVCVCDVRDVVHVYMHARVGCVLLSGKLKTGCTPIICDNITLVLMCKAQASMGVGGHALPPPYPPPPPPGKLLEL